MGTFHKIEDTPPLSSTATIICLGEKFFSLESLDMEN